MTSRRYPVEIRAAKLLSRWYFLKARKQGLPANATLEAHAVARHWGWGDNILGVAAGWKRVKGKLVRDQLAVTVYVRKKWSNRSLSPEGRIPERLVIPGMGIDVVTDVVPMPGPPVAQEDFPRIRPLQPGVEVAHLLGGAGSLADELVPREAE